MGTSYSNHRKSPIRSYRSFINWAMNWENSLPKIKPAPRRGKKGCTGTGPLQFLRQPCNSASVKADPHKLINNLSVQTEGLECILGYFKAKTGECS